MRPCFTFTAKAAAGAAKATTALALDEEIGFYGTQAAQFRTALNAVATDDLEVEINSPGGDVVAGLGMYNMLRTWAAGTNKTLTTRVGGIAASIASVIALAGDKREMPKNTFAMMHQVSSGAWGTADDLREAAEVTDKFNVSLRNIYVDRMGVDEATATAIMAKDTWLTAEECLEMGFATGLTDAVHATAKFDVLKAELPTNVAAVFKAKEDPKDPPEDLPEVKAEGAIAEQVVALANTAGLQAFANLIALHSTTLVDGQARITAGTEIVALCKLANRPDDAKAAIAQNKSVKDVRAALVTAMAKADEHTSTVPPANRTAGKTGVKTSNEVYEARAKAKADKRAAGRK